MPNLEPPDEDIVDAMRRIPGYRNVSAVDSREIDGRDQGHGAGSRLPPRGESAAQDGAIQGGDGSGLTCIKGFGVAMN
jgi:hypothetical protein